MASDRIRCLTRRSTNRNTGSLVASASRSSACVVDEVGVFANTVRRGAHTDPDEVAEHRRQDTPAFRAGDHASARAVFEAVLLPIAQGDINFGQHEILEDMLKHRSTRHGHAIGDDVYTTTPLGGRANALYRAMTHVEGIASRANPIADTEGVSARAFPNLGPFLPRRVKRLERLTG